MPNMQVQELPAAQQIKRQLHSQWQIEASALGKTYFKDKRQGEAKVAQLNAKYQRLELDAMTKFQQQQAEQQRVRNLISQPQERSRGQEATLRMQLDPEAERLVFPKEDYLSPQYLRSGGFRDNLAGYIGAAEDTPGWEWGPPKKKKQSLVDQYRRWRKSELYHTKSTQERQQLDREWDANMASSPIYDKWWSDKTKHRLPTEVRALRSTGRMAGAMRNKVTGITPLSRSLSRSKQPAPSRQEREPIVQSRQGLLAEYKKLGGGKSPEGRQFADQYLK